MEMNEKALSDAFEKIKASEGLDVGTLSLAWLIVCGDKIAILIDSRDDVKLFELNGKLCFRHSCDDPDDESYFEAIDFFENSFSGSAEDIITLDDQQTDKLIAENISELNSLHDGKMDIQYVCSIFKLNKLFGIPSDDIQDSFYMRFGAVGENGRTLLYHDIEYLQNDAGVYECIDDFTLKADTHIDKDTVRVIKISKQALTEFIYENFVAGQEKYLDVKATEVSDYFEFDPKTGEFIFCAVKSEDEDGKFLTMPEKVDLKKVMKNIPDTAESVLGP
jgi:hypothetical protein